MYCLHKLKTIQSIKAIAVETLPCKAAMVPNSDFDYLENGRVAIVLYSINDHKFGMLIHDKAPRSNIKCPTIKRNIPLGQGLFSIVT